MRRETRPTSCPWPWRGRHADPPDGSTARDPDLRWALARQRQHQLVQPLDEAGGVLELPAFRQQRLVEQDVTPVGEAGRVGLRLQPLDDWMAGVDLEHRPGT